MLRFICGRLIQSAVLLVLISMIGFAVLHLAPGGPLSQFTLTPGLSQADLNRVANQLGLDRPLPVQYASYMRDLLSLNFGRSIQTQRYVREDLAAFFPATAELTKVFVAATLRSGPARMSMAKSEARASGESAVLVMATVRAPPARAVSAMATMSGLLPDWEIARQAEPASLSLAP